MEGDNEALKAECKAVDFYPRPPHGGRLQDVHYLFGFHLISIHALRMEGDDDFVFFHVSNHQFLSTPSAWRATFSAFAGFTVQGSISIHALRMEGDARQARCVWARTDFYPRPPHGGRLSHSRGLPSSSTFLSTPSAWRATGVILEHPNNFLFLSTPSAWRATAKADKIIKERWDFYPRPPHGGRRNQSLKAVLTSNFYPRPPHGGRREVVQPVPGIGDFYPRPPHGGRQFDLMNIYAKNYFYPRPPHGGRPASRRCGSAPMKFLSTPSAWRATDWDYENDISTRISIHALRMEGDSKGS